MGFMFGAQVGEGGEGAGLVGGGGKEGDEGVCSEEEGKEQEAFEGRGAGVACGGGGGEGGEEERCDGGGGEDV